MKFLLILKIDQLRVAYQDEKELIKIKNPQINFQNKKINY